MEKLRPQECLITGATGIVGVPLVRELLSRGHRVRILARSAVDYDLFDRPVDVIRGDLLASGTIETAAKGVDLIFHLAAKLHVNNPEADLRNDYWTTNVNATEKLLAAAVENGARKFVFFSTISVYGPGRRDRIFDETSDLNPIGLYAESKAAAEKLVLAARSKQGEKIGVVLRLAAVYGSRMKGNYVRLTNAIRRGRFFFIGPGENRRTLVHQDDAAAAAAIAAEKAAGGSIYNVTNGGIHSLSQIVEAVSTALGKDRPRLHLPEMPVTLCVSAAERVAEAIGIKPPVSRQLLQKFLEDVAVDGTKMQRELGFQPRFNLERGWRQAVSK